MDVIALLPKLVEPILVGIVLYGGLAVVFLALRRRR